MLHLRTGQSLFQSSRQRRNRLLIDNARSQQARTLENSNVKKFGALMIFNTEVRIQASSHRFAFLATIQNLLQSALIKLEHRRFELTAVIPFYLHQFFALTSHFTRILLPHGKPNVLICVRSHAQQIQYRILVISQSNISLQKKIAHSSSSQRNPPLSILHLPDHRVQR